MATNAPIRRHHHITLCVGGAQEDYDFHTQVLGLKSVKKTALYDGDVPIFHLYYGNDLGQES
ncbi:MAG: VOC family protein, partial [Acidimicrobiaceae bacterium]|nr:VOC family protein [Acidimicrobiaceae bacterium]